MVAVGLKEVKCLECLKGMEAALKWLNVLMIVEDQVQKLRVVVAELVEDIYKERHALKTILS
jgi:hypothetical protein